MSKSIIIRHAKTRKSWDALPYKELIRLIKQETNPSIDKDFLQERLDADKLKKINIKKIYSSPAKRAIQTAKYISRIIKSPIIIIPELNEIKFDVVPCDKYQEGKESIRDFLFKKSIQTDISERMAKIKALMKENAILVTHGFVMRLIFSQIFGRSIHNLRTDKRFTQYLSGFECSTGKSVSFLKEMVRRNENE